MFSSVASAPSAVSSCGAWKLKSSASSYEAEKGVLKEGLGCTGLPSIPGVAQTGGESQAFWTGILRHLDTLNACLQHAARCGVSVVVQQLRDVTSRATAA